MQYTSIDIRLCGIGRSCCSNSTTVCGDVFYDITLRFDLSEYEPLFVLTHLLRADIKTAIVELLPLHASYVMGTFSASYILEHAHEEVVLKAYEWAFEDLRRQTHYCVELGLLDERDNWYTITPKGQRVAKVYLELADEIKAKIEERIGQ